MPIRQFLYEAVDGAGRTLKGEVTAASERDALRDLTKRGLVPLSVHLAKTPHRHVVEKLKIRSKPSTRDYALALKQLSLLLKAGLPLIQATDGLKRQSVHPVLAGQFEKVAGRLRSGEAFHVAFEAVFGDIPHYVHRLTAAGEATGRLGESLADAAAQMEYDLQIAQETKNALTYPAILVTAGFFAVVFIFVVVVPRFAEMVGRSDVTLPLISRIVFAIGTFMNTHTTAVSVLFIGGLVAIVMAFRSDKIRLQVKSLLGQAPIVGQWLKESEIARWAMLMSTMLNNGIELLSALRLSEPVVTLPTMRVKFQQVEKAVRGGVSVSRALEDQEAVPATALSLVEVGEEAGELPQMLESIARLYEESGRQRMKKFLTLLEPAAILFLGVVVGGIVTAVMLALTSINQISL